MGHSMSNQHKFLPPLISMKIGSYTVSAETLIHNEFQYSMLFGFRVRARQKIDFSKNFSLPFVTLPLVTIAF